MKKKFLSILAAFAVLVSFSACQSQQSTELIDSVTTVVEETAEPVEMKTIEPPEDGWTVETVSNIFYINHKPITLPFKVDNLGKEFDIKELDTTILDSGACGTILYYNEVPFLIINYIDVQEYEQLYQKEAYSISTLYNDMNNDYINDYISVNGIQHGDSMSKVEAALGTADKKTNNSLIYINKNTNENFLGFLFNENGELYTISFIFE